MLTQSAPVYYPHMTSMSLPTSSGFSLPQRGFGGAHATAFRPVVMSAAGEGSAALSSASTLPGSEDATAQAPQYTPFGGHVLYPVPMESEEAAAAAAAASFRLHASSAGGRRGSAPAVPMMMMMSPGAHAAGFHWQAASPMLSASYGDYGAHSFVAAAAAAAAAQAEHGTVNGFPMMPERKHSPGSPGSRSAASRRASSRPAGVPALSFSGLSHHHHAHAPASASAALGHHHHLSAMGTPSMMVLSSNPHSARSMSSALSDYEPQYSPMSTPRSNGSTPRSSTSTPRSGSVNEKKRARTGVPHPLERERRVRPKVVAEKGALQCKGINRKKNTRCRNAALMEYIGPRPLYCAEHITLDPESYYSKCASTFHKVHGDGKGCREVVLKELNFCHKHYNQALDVMLDGTEVGFIKARTQLDRISTLQAQLESEAAAAKRIDPDLFQRKHKLIPKFMEMRKLLVKRMQEFESSFSHLLPATAIEFKFKTYEEQTDSKDSSSISTTSPSGTSDDGSVGHFDEPQNPALMQVEPQNYPVY